MLHSVIRVSDSCELHDLVLGVRSVDDATPRINRYPVDI